MVKTTNAKCHINVEKLQEFKASNLSGEYIYRDGKVKFYVVKSYDWYPLLVWSMEKLCWYVNKEKQSASTSRQLSQAKPAGAIHAIELTHLELKSMMA